MTQDGDWKHDAELLDRWRAGDQRAGAKLYDRHCGAVMRLFQNKLPDQAEDLTQQTFLALIEARDTIRNGVSMRAFVLGIARFKLIDQLRKLCAQRPVDPDSHSIADLAPGPSTIVARKREQQLVLEGLRRIPIEHQLALELFYWEGLKANEIADVFGVSHSAMRSRLSKARQLLEAAIAELAASPVECQNTISNLDAWAEQIRARL